MFKKTLIIALIGLMVGGVAMGVISLADRSSTSGGRRQEQANAASTDLPQGQGQGRGQRSEVSETGRASFGGRNIEAGAEVCDGDDCTSGNGHKGQAQMSGSRGASSRGTSGNGSDGQSTEQGKKQSACEQSAGVRGAEQGRRQYTTEQAAGVRGAEQGRRQYTTEQAAGVRGAEQGRRQYNMEQAAGTPSTDTRNSVNGQGSRGNGGNSSQAEPVEQITVEGSVVSLGEHIVIELEDGTQLELGMGPEFYREEIGFSTEVATKVGDKLTVTGFHEDGEFKVLSILDASGTLMIFRDEYGRPGWSGRGNRQNSNS